MPFSLFTGMAATLGQPHGQPETDEERAALAHTLLVSFLSQMYDQAFMRGGTDAVAALDNPSGNRPLTWIKRTVATVIVPPIVAQTVKMWSPETKTPDTFVEHITSRLGFGGTPRRTITGDTTGGRGGLAALSPFTISAAVNDPVANMMMEAGADVSRPSRRVNDERLSAADYGRYQEATAENLRNRMAWYLENPQVWARMTREERAEEVKSEADKARAEARSELFPQ